MSAFEVQIKFKGIDFVVKGFYSNFAGTYWEPPDVEFAPEVIQSVNPKFQEFVDFFNEQLSENEEFFQLCVDAINEQHYPDVEPDDC